MNVHILLNKYKYIIYSIAHYLQNMTFSIFLIIDYPVNVQWFCVYVHYMDKSTGPPAHCTHGNLRREGAGAQFSCLS